MAAAGAISDFQNESRSAHDKAGKERGNRTRSIKTRPQDSQDEASGDWRADIGLHTLQVNVELAADVMDERNPQQTEQHHDASGNSPEIYELFFRSLRAKLLVEIESDQRGG